MGEVQGVPLFICFILGFALSLLFLMDQNISAAMVDSPAHKLKKGKHSRKAFELNHPFRIGSTWIFSLRLSKYFSADGNISHHRLVYFLDYDELHSIRLFKVPPMTGIFWWSEF